MDQQQQHRRKMTKLPQDLKTIVNTSLFDFQIRLYYEIELQITDKAHPVQVLIRECFNTAFMNHYKQYVVKSSAQTSTSDLLNKIINKTVGMQNEYVF